MNKREFVLSGCAGAVGALGWIGSSEAFAASRAGQVESARLAGWQRRLGDEFALQSAPAGTLRLHEIREATAAPRLEQFTLVFVSEGQSRARPAGTAILRDAGGRPMALYLEPLANVDSRSAARYAAHFSILT